MVVTVCVVPIMGYGYSNSGSTLSGSTGSPLAWHSDGRVFALAEAVL